MTEFEMSILSDPMFSPLHYITQVTTVFPGRLRLPILVQKMHYEKDLLYTFGFLSKDPALPRFVRYLSRNPDFPDAVDYYMAYPSVTTVLVTLRPSTSEHLQWYWKVHAQIWDEWVVPGDERTEKEYLRRMWESAYKYANVI